MTVFIGFNSVLFQQYFVWAIPFFPLLISETVGVSAGLVNANSRALSERS
jgi:hypothetical protein